MTRVGWTCGKCGDPVAGRFSTCKNCGHGPESRKKAVQDQLNDLISQARRERKWLHCSYQDLWFSPDELEKENSNGKFRWGPINFTLKSTEEFLLQKKRTLDAAETEYIAALERVRSCR